MNGNNMNGMNMNGMNNMNGNNMNGMNNMNGNNINGNNMNDMLMNRGYQQRNNSNKQNQNFSMGGREGTNADLENRVSTMRNHVANSIGLDPQALLHMTPEEIEKQIKNQKNKNSNNNLPSYQKKQYIKKNNNDYNDNDNISDNDDNDNDNDNDNDDNDDKKTRLLKMLIDMKKNNMNKKNGLKKAVKNYKSQSESESESEPNTETDSDIDTKKSKKNKKNKNVKFTKDTKFNDKLNKSNKSDKNLKQNNKKKIESESDSESESGSQSNSESDSPEETKKNIKKSVQKQIKRQNVKIEISPSDENIKYYSDFMIDFGNKYNTIYKNITNMKLKINKLNIIPEIKEPYNKLNIIIGNQTKKIELEDGVYPLNDLVDGISENLEDVNIVCKVDKKGRVIIENTDGNDFKIECGNESFGKFLGFTESNYENSSKYISESPSLLNKQDIYLFFTNLSSKPIYKIDSDNNITQLIKLDKIIKELDCLIIQIKDTDTSEETDLHDFCGDLYSFELSFECDKN
jgi:hypothetical protein